MILASRSEVKRGEWKQFENGPFKVQAMGSVAYKLALVSAGLADITFTLTPKNEWDVVAGAALVRECRRVRQHPGEDQPDRESARSASFGSAGQQDLS